MELLRMEKSRNREICLFTIPRTSDASRIFATFKRQVTELPDADGEEIHTIILVIACHRPPDLRDSNAIVNRLFAYL